MCRFSSFCSILLVTLLVVLPFISIRCDAQLYRAASPIKYQQKYDQEYVAEPKVPIESIIEDDEPTPLNHSEFMASNDAASSAARIITTNNDYQLWLISVCGTAMIGFSGILPVLILPQLADNHEKLVKLTIFKCLTAFAAGSLLGDVFIHLLPETYSSISDDAPGSAFRNGVWSLVGIFLFLLIEKIFPDSPNSENNDDIIEKRIVKVQVSSKRKTKKVSPKKQQPQPSRMSFGFGFLRSIKTIGILNLLANVIDNFMHGIAVAGSFQASFKFGVMTLLATLLHEIPHEIGDFVILLRAGLSCREAAMAQAVTAFAGIFGAIFALEWGATAEQAGDACSWILPFTSGCFVYIALVGIVPDILAETHWRVYTKQLISVFTGIASIYWFSLIF